MTMKNKINLIDDLVAKNLISALQDPEGASPGMIQCALRYLSDNVKDGAVIEPGSAIDQILDSLPFKMTGTDD